MKLTRAQILATIKPGDLIVVHYIHPGIVGAGIQWASGGKASHALCCLGGMEIVEADIGGVMHTYLDNYMTGKCCLTIKRLRPNLSAYEASLACAYWRSRISYDYDLGMIVHSALVAPVRRFLAPRLPRMSHFLLRLIGLIPLASATLSTCAELGARGARKPRPSFLRHYAPDDITPEVLLRDATGLETVAVWYEALLVDK